MPLDAPANAFATGAGPRAEHRRAPPVAAGPGAAPPSDEDRYPLIGELLVAAGHVEAAARDAALATQQRSRQRLGDLLGPILPPGAVDLERLERLQRSRRQLTAILPRFGLKPRQIVQAVRRVDAGEPIARVMHDTGYLGEEAVAQVVALQQGLQYGAPSLLAQVDAGGLARAGIDVRARHPFVPVTLLPDGALLVALADPEARSAAHNAWHGRRALRYVLASRDTVQTIWCRHFARIDVQLHEALDDAERLQRRLAAGDAVDETAHRRLLGLLLRYGCFSGASDLKLYTTLYRGTLNARIDGVGRDVAELGRPLFDALWTLLAHDARIAAETVADRLAEGAVTFAQDATMRREFADLFDRYAFRLELGGSAGGGRTAAIRILDAQASGTTLDEVGYAPDDLAVVRRALAEPDGLVLLTGPTGSGKTTTLYSMLATLDPEEKSIQTIENPVERRHGKWLQYEVGKGSADIERDVFLEHFRQLLRNDPDVVMVGEIRSREVAALTLQAAQTGHLVLSTLHVDRAHHAIGRLRGLGVAPEELVDHLRLVVAQRLVRRLCPACARPDDDPALAARLAAARRFPAAGAPVPQAPRPRRANPAGCDCCGHSGYRGRAMVYELLEVDAAVRTCVADGAHAAALERLLHDGPAARASLWDCGLRLVAEGITSLAALRESVSEPR